MVHRQVPHIQHMSDSSMHMGLAGSEGRAGAGAGAGGHGEEGHMDAGGGHGDEGMYSRYLGKGSHNRGVRLRQYRYIQQSHNERMPLR